VREREEHIVLLAVLQVGWHVGDQSSVAQHNQLKQRRNCNDIQQAHPMEKQ
jgi:hypothetical protein